MPPLALHARYGAVRMLPSEKRDTGRAHSTARLAGPSTRRHHRHALRPPAAASSPEPTDAERTTEKYGLEAGLWKVLTSKQPAEGGGGGDGPATLQPLSKAAQAKALLKTYGSAYLLTSISFAVVSFGACYALVSAGVDVAALLEKVGLRYGATGERVGTFALAYAAHKALSPVRFPPTVALTPVVARWLGRKPADGEGEGTGGGGGGA